MMSELGADAQLGNERSAGAKAIAVEINRAELLMSNLL
jgi:hypothetical protein